MRPTNQYMIYGGGHLANTTRRALQLLGFREDTQSVDLVFVAEDVVDHNDTTPAADALRNALEQFRKPSRPDRHDVPIVVLSQVQPCWTRTHVGVHSGVFYQVDTIIVSRAVDRMVRPEQVIVGCADPHQALPLNYQMYLAALNCPVRQMSYESAELAKIAINYFLSVQIDTTNELSLVAEDVGASWEDVASALRGDARIGPHAYLRPGQPNQHLTRDVNTVEVLTDGVFNPPPSETEI